MKRVKKVLAFVSLLLMCTSLGAVGLPASSELKAAYCMAVMEQALAIPRVVGPWREQPPGLADDADQLSADASTIRRKLETAKQYFATRRAGTDERVISAIVQSGQSDQLAYVKAINDCKAHDHVESGGCVAPALLSKLRWCGNTSWVSY